MKVTEKPIDIATKKAEAALAERSRLQELGRDLEARRGAMVKSIAEAKVASGNADALVMLATQQDRPALERQADAEAAKLVETERELLRLDGARQRLPAMLAATDQEIEVAYKLFASEVESQVAAARNDLAAKLRPVAAQLGDLLRQGHALAAAGVAMPNLLSNTSVGHPSRLQPFIAGSTMTLADETVALDKEWRDNPAAVALFDLHISNTALKRQLERDMARINEDRGRQLREANRLSHARSFETPPPQQFDTVTTSPEVQVEPRFVPNADTHSPPHDGNVQDGTIRINIDMDTTEKLSPSQIDALWQQWQRVSGVNAPQALDPEDIELAGRLAPWRANTLIRRRAERARGMERRKDTESAAAGVGR